MKEVTLNGIHMDNKEKVHQYIREQLNTLEYHGNNLDALWDVLSCYSEPIKISIINIKNLTRNLEDYGESILEVFKDAEQENNNISLKIKD